MQRMVLRTATECEGLARSHVPLSLFGSGDAITLDLPIDRAAQARLQTELDRLLRTCGCVESSLVVVVTLALGLTGIWGLGLGGALALNRWGLSAGILVIALSLAGLTKLAILLRARRRLRDSMLELAGLGRPSTGG